MRVSPSFTLSLLTEFTFRHCLRLTEPTSAALGRMTALYARYGLRVIRLELPYEFNSSLVDQVTGQSLLPSSLTDLRLGHRYAMPVTGPPVYLCDVLEEDEAAKDSIDDRVRLYHTRMTASQMMTRGPSESSMNQPIPPGALPLTLQRLQIGWNWNQYVVAGALPPSLTWLRFGADFRQHLSVGVLPSSITHLSLGESFDHELLPGVLPASLIELEVGWMFDQALHSGSLPAGLRRLTMFGKYNYPFPPGILPSSLTHLHLGDHYNQPLQPSSLPSSLMHLCFGERYNLPLTAGLLPSSLRELHFVPWQKSGSFGASAKFSQPILPGQLPEGLESLVLPLNYPHEVGVGVLPDSLLVLDLGKRYFSTELGLRGVDRVIPRGLRWLRMRQGDHERVQDELPAGMQCCWHDEVRRDANQYSQR